MNPEFLFLLVLWFFFLLLDVARFMNPPKRQHKKSFAGKSHNASLIQKPSEGISTVKFVFSSSRWCRAEHIGTESFLLRIGWAMTRIKQFNEFQISSLTWKLVSLVHLYKKLNCYLKQKYFWKQITEAKTEIWYQNCLNFNEQTEAQTFCFNSNESDQVLSKSKVIATLTYRQLWAAHFKHSHVLCLALILCALRFDTHKKFNNFFCIS